jgi:hypothetical protein
MRNKRGYNGWKNRETWNVALWIQNDEGLYRAACKFMQSYKGRTPYRDFANALIDVGLIKTPDGVRYVSSKLSYSELNRMMRDLLA